MNFQTTAVFDFLMATKKSYFHSLAKNCLFYSYWMTRNAMGGRVFCSFGLISSFNTKTLFTFSTKFPLCEILLFILIKRLPGMGTVGLSPRPQHLPKVCLTPDRQTEQVRDNEKNRYNWTMINLLCFMNTLKRRANARNVSCETSSGGQFKLSSQLIKPSYLVFMNSSIKFVALPQRHN